MAVITGTLLDFSLDALAPYSPRLIFTGSQPATAGGKLLSTRPFMVRVEADGSFSVDVQPNDVTYPATYYTVRVEWLDADDGFIGVDLWDFPIYVPSSGGNIGDLMQTTANPQLAWVGVNPPSGVLPVATVWWLQVNPDDPDDPRATGILYEWG